MPNRSWSNRLSPRAWSLFWTSCVLGAAVAQGPCHDLQGITSIAQELLSTYPADGSSCVRYEQFGQQRYEQAFGSFTLGQVVPIASATKTLSAAVLMSLVDSGVLSLDDRVGQWLPEWNTGLRAQITLRMCFSHTAGMLAAHPLVGDDTTTLRQAAFNLASVPLQAVPGNRFVYGGVSMHVAGAVCEVASGQSWAQLFAQRIAVPCQLTATDYLGIGSATNPRIAGGARSNLRDFANFMTMLRQRGQWNGVQVLSAASVDTMLTDQTSSVPIGSTPHPQQAPYGIGIWLDRRDSLGRTLVASAVGAFGFAGWVDRAHDGSGVFVVDFDNPITWPYVQRMWQVIDDAVLPPGVSCLGQGSPPCAAGAWLNGSSSARGSNVDFALRASQVPPSMPGALLLGDPAPGGVPIADLLAFLGPQLDVVAGLVADANGRASIAAPLSPTLVGAQFGLQSVWLSPGGCTALGLQGSHALTVTVLP
ncbi:MAG: beta-lactamase family protein [Planctomycetes bacterium]|jgi:CubicO group peptidase (beta-lactamase class C family)|nr:beta-lactamase family protein [Planctomycetota bacterium]